jgi:hypothetical protein
MCFLRMPLIACYEARRHNLTLASKSRYQQDATFTALTNRSLVALKTAKAVRKVMAYAKRGGHR